MAAAFEVTSGERREYERRVQRLSPEDGFHEDYLESAGEFIEDVEAFAPALGDNLPIRRARMAKSKMFERQYLVVEMDQAWFEGNAPHCNAIASIGLTFVEICEAPPLVLVPYRTRFLGKNRSILEHEVVHVNQALGGFFPEFDDDALRAPLKALLNFAVAEYEANFLQYVWCPEMRPSELPQDISLTRWSLIRGCSQAFEKFAALVASGKIEINVLKATLNSLEDAFGARLKDERIPRSQVEWTVQYLKPWMELATRRMVGTGANPTIQTLMSWSADK